METINQNIKILKECCSKVQFPFFDEIKFKRTYKYYIEAKQFHLENGKCSIHTLVNLRDANLSKKILKKVQNQIIGYQIKKFEIIPKINKEDFPLGFTGHYLDDKIGIEKKIAPMPGQITLFLFWAPWIENCLKPLYDIEKIFNIHSDWKGFIKCFALSYEYEHEKMKSLLKDQPFNNIIHVLLPGGSANSIVNRLFIKDIPYLLIVNQEGIIEINSSPLNLNIEEEIIQIINDKILDKKKISNFVSYIKNTVKYFDLNKDEFTPILQVLSTKEFSENVFKFISFVKPIKDLILYETSNYELNERTKIKKYLIKKIPEFVNYFLLIRQCICISKEVIILPIKKMEFLNLEIQKIQEFVTLLKPIIKYFNQLENPEIEIKIQSSQDIALKEKIFEILPFIKIIQKYFYEEEIEDLEITKQFLIKEILSSNIIDKVDNFSINLKEIYISEKCQSIHKCCYKISFIIEANSLLEPWLKEFRSKLIEKFDKFNFSFNIEYEPYFHLDLVYNCSICSKKWNRDYYYVCIECNPKIFYCSSCFEDLKAKCKEHEHAVLLVFDDSAKNLNKIINFKFTSKLKENYDSEEAFKNGFKCDICKTINKKGPLYKCAICYNIEVCDECIQIIKNLNKIKIGEILIKPNQKNHEMREHCYIRILHDDMVEFEDEKLVLIDDKIKSDQGSNNSILKSEYFYTEINK